MIEDSETMEDAIEAVVERVLYNEVSTFFPGTITKVKRSPVNANTVIVDVESSFLTVDPETNQTKPRRIQSVPLMMVAKTNTFIIRPPLDDASLIGASVGLIVANNYLANWKKTGGTVLPTDGRKYHYADAVAMFGLCPDVMSWSTPPKENTAQIKALDGTYLEVGNSTVDIPRLLADFLDIVLNAKDAEARPLVFSPSTVTGDTIAQLITKIATLYNPDTAP
jgi:hypothetical protein